METHDIIKLLQGRQISPTRQRVDIAQLLFSRPQHLCAEQVLDELEVRGRGRASKATVYNTLNLFSHHGLLREVCVDAGKVYFDSNTAPHHHIYNIDTGELWDVEAEADISTAPLSLPDGTVSIGVDVIYRIRGAARSKS
jgi:Fur family iron response transcriptional regulator